MQFFGIFFLQVLKEPWGEYMKDERKAFRKRVVSLCDTALLLDCSDPSVRPIGSLGLVRFC